MLTFWSQPARNTDIALTLNRVPRCTPFESPESNGMEEAFVKTLKRDHVRISAIPMPLPPRSHQPRDGGLQHCSLHSD